MHRPNMVFVLQTKHNFSDVRQAEYMWRHIRHIIDTISLGDSLHCDVTSDARPRLAYNCCRSSTTTKVSTAAHISQVAAIEKSNGVSLVPDLMVRRQIQRKKKQQRKNSVCSFENFADKYSYGSTNQINLTLKQEDNTRDYVIIEWEAEAPSSSNSWQAV